jgi:hypothetical protein
VGNFDVVLYYYSGVKFLTLAIANGIACDFYYLPKPSLTFMKNVHYLSVVLVLLIIITLNYGAYGQIVTVGSGSYTTQLPPPDAAGRNQNPNGTPRLSGPAATKPVPTSDWWTGLLTFSGANLYNYPMSLRAMTNGLVVSYTAPVGGGDDTRQPMSGDQPLLVGVSGLNVTNATVDDHSDWTVTANWGNRLYATMGMGMPFVYFTKGASDVASVTVNMGTVSIQSEMLLVTGSLGGSNFAVYAPVGSTWVQNGITYTSTLRERTTSPWRCCRTVLLHLPLQQPLNRTPTYSQRTLQCHGLTITLPLTFVRLTLYQHQ